MARWKLTEAHYLFGYPPDLEEEGTQWEYKETDRITGREKRKRFKVPFYFDEGTIVCHQGKGQAEDFVFEGDPTPSMTPLDAEAKAISAELAPKWVLPMGEEAFPGQGFSEALAKSFEKQIERLAKIAPMPTPANEVGITRAEFDTLREQMAQLMARNAELEAKPKVTSNRRAV